MNEKVPELRRHIHILETLLIQAACPVCDGSGGIPQQVGDQESEQEQCQWCAELNTLIDAERRAEYAKKPK